MSTPTISVKELQKMLEEGKQVNVLDIRPQDQREEWKIADSTHANAYDNLLAGDRHALDEVKLAEDIPVVTVCSGGRTSLIAADLMNERGYQAFSLEGGMKAWNYVWNTAEITENDLKLIQVRRVAKGCLSYIIGSGNEAIIIDASLDSAVYEELAAKHNWTIKHVMDTHIHADYISRTIELAKSTGANHLFTDLAEVDYQFTPLKDGENLIFGNTTLKVIHTPGHTPESISFLINEKYLLTGDTLFVDGVGRPDLKADTQETVNKANQLYVSLEKIKSLGKDLLILPAHTSQTIRFDKKIIAGELSELMENIQLLRLSQNDFVEQITQRIPPTPPNYLQIASINKSGKYDGFNPADLEAGANRCAIS